MRSSVLLALAFALLACRNENRPAQRPSPRPLPAAKRDAAADPPPRPPAPATHVLSEVDGGRLPAGVVRTFRLGEAVCVRDAARAALSASATGFFSASSLELEVRNINFSCTPAPTFEASLDGTTVHLRYQPASRVAFTRCSCRLDQFLQVAGIAPGNYDLVVEEASPGDAGSHTVATGHIGTQVR
jgi:hypothetical protein